MKSKWKVLAVVAVIAVLLAAIGSGMAYFTTYARTDGQRPVSLGTEIEETITDWAKHVVIKADQNSFPVYVRAKAFADSRFAVSYTPSEGWKDGGDGFYYYEKILYAGESTTELLVQIPKEEVKKIPEEELKGFEFNVVVVYECTKAIDDEGNIIEPNWEQPIDLSGGN